MKKTLAWVLLCTIAVILLFLVSGCSRSWYQRRDITRQHIYNYTYPNELAKDCAKWFPVKDSTGKPKPAVNKDYSGEIDSLKHIADSLGNAKPVTKADTQKFITTIAGLREKITDLAAMYKPCKPDTIPHFIVDNALLNTIKGELTAKNDSLQNSKGQVEQLKTDKKGLSKWIWILGGILVAEILIIIIWIVFKIYTGGASGIAGNIIKKV